MDALNGEKGVSLVAVRREVSTGEASGLEMKEVSLSGETSADKEETTFRERHVDVTEHDSTQAPETLDDVITEVF